MKIAILSVMGVEFNSLSAMAEHLGSKNDWESHYKSISRQSLADAWDDLKVVDFGRIILKDKQFRVDMDEQVMVLKKILVERKVAKIKDGMIEIITPILDYELES